MQKINLYYIILTWLYTRKIKSDISLKDFVDNIDIKNIKVDIVKQRENSLIFNRESDKYMSCVIINDEIKNLAQENGINSEVLSSWINVINKIANRNLKINGQLISIKDNNPQQVIDIVKNLINQNNFEWNNEVVLKATRDNKPIYISIKQDKTNIIDNSKSLYNYYRNVDDYKKNVSNYTLVKYNGEQFAVNDNEYISLSKDYLGDRYVKRNDLEDNNSLLDTLISIKNDARLMQQQDNYDFLKPIRTKQEYEEEKKKFEGLAMANRIGLLASTVSDSFTYILEQKREQIIERLKAILNNDNISVQQRANIEKKIDEIRENNIALLKQIGGIQTIFKEIYDFASKCQYEIDRENIIEQIKL